MIFILSCSWLPLPPCLPAFVSLHDFLSGLLLAAAAAALSSKLISLHDLHSRLLLAAAALFRVAVGCRCRLVSLHLSPFIISGLDCSWLPLPPCLLACVSLHDLHSGLLLATALFSKLVSLHDLRSGLLLAAAATL